MSEPPARIVLVEPRERVAQAILRRLASEPRLRLRRARTLRRRGVHGARAILLGPSLGGAELAATLERASALAGDVPVLVLLEADDPDLARRAIRWGAEDALPLSALDGAGLERSLGLAIERRRRQAALRRNEARFRLLAENVRDLVFLYRLSAPVGFDYVSPAAPALLGYAPEEYYANPRLLLEVARDGERARLAGVLRGDGPYGSPVRIDCTHRDGRALTVELRAVPVRDESGRVVAVEGLLLDVTAQSRTEERLRESEARYRAILEALPDMILRVRRDGTYLEFKPAAAFPPAVPPEEFLGKKMQDVLPPELAAIAEAAVVRALATRRTELVEYSLPVGDETRYFEARHVPYAEDEVLALVRDMSEKRRSLDALRASERRFRRVFEDAPIGMALVDPEGRPVAVNARLEAMLGYGRDELRRMTFAELTHPEDVDEDLRFFREMIAGRRERYEMEKRYVRKDGRIVWGRLIGTLVRDADEEPEYAIGMVEDITRRKEAEAALRESEEQLRQAQKMEALGRLAGGLAHDFNNLLTGILGYTELALQELAPDSPLRGDIEEIRRSGERAARLTRQLLAFSRRQVLRPEVLDVNEVVTELSTMLRRLIGENIDLATRLDADVGPVRADRGQLEQVLINLVLNARDAMPGGGRLVLGTRSVRREEPEKRKGFTIPPGRYTRIAVADTGHGMDEETLEHIFEPFFTTKGKGQGTGLGLATVYGIVKQSGGHIVVTTRPGRGTTFHIDLPECPAGARRPRAPGAAARDASSPHARSILVVEDEEAVRALAERILSTKGYTVRTAPDGERALAMAAREPDRIDLVITDVILPGLSGTDVARRLRESRPDTKVLFMSGYTDNATVRDLVEGGTPFLQKPFTARGLLEAVEDVLVGAGGGAPKPSPNDD